jgi:hypothetical protein
VIPAGWAVAERTLTPVEQTGRPQTARFGGVFRADVAVIDGHNRFDSCVVQSLARVGASGAGDSVRLGDYTAANVFPKTAKGVSPVL